MIDLKIRLTKNNPPGVLKKKIRPIQTAALRDILLDWHRETLPKHFEFSAYKRYGAVYESRTKKYEKTKARMFGNRAPLIWTGKLQTELTRRAEVRTSTRGAKLSMWGHALNFSGRGSGSRRTQKNYPDLKAEVVATNQEEVDAQARDLQDRIVAELARRQGRSVKVFD